VGLWEEPILVLFERRVCLSIQWEQLSKSESNIRLVGAEGERNDVIWDSLPADYRPTSLPLQHNFKCPNGLFLGLSSEGATFESRTGH
jgi:hypothetical protein